MIGKYPKIGKKWPRNRVFEILRKSSHYFFQKMISSHGRLTFSSNHMSGKNLVLKLRPKMISGNQS